MTSWKNWLAVPTALGIVLAVSGSAVAKLSSVNIADVPTASSDGVASLTSTYSDEPIELAQVTSVAELSDVQPDDWAFVSLQRLVEEYGCLEGYPDGSFRGASTLTRNEFAAGLNTCLDVVVQLIQDEQESGIRYIRRPQEAQAADLATLRGEIDSLETALAELDAYQFSPTTKLRGQLDMHLVFPF